VNSCHHLVRVRMNKRMFQQLKEIAKTETDESGQYVSVSDIIRAACLIWKQTYESRKRIEKKAQNQ